VISNLNVIRGNQLPSTPFVDDGPDTLDDRAIRRSLIVQDQHHSTARRKVTFVSRVCYVFAQTTILEATQHLGIQLRFVPFVRPRHRDRDRLPRMNDDVNISAIWSGTIHPPGMEVGGIELYDFVARSYPIKGSFRLRPQTNGRQNNGYPEQKQVSHINEEYSAWSRKPAT
jgi:hypothetical protein